MTTPQPGIGDWYRLNGGALFEVVAFDDDDGTIEIQQRRRAILSRSVDGENSHGAAWARMMGARGA